MSGDIITAASSPNNCSHFVIDGLDNGVTPWTLRVTDADLQAPLTAEEMTTMRMLLMRHLRQRGVTLQQFVNRVVRGEEATNMKVYNLIGKGSAISKINVGTAYINISPRLNGERELVDFTGCTEFRLVGWANLLGTGNYQFRVVRDSDGAVLYESPTVNAGAERELDSNWQALPAQASGLIFVRIEMKSSVGVNDPVIGGIQLAVR